MKVKFTTTQDVTEFVNAAMKSRLEIDVVSGQHRVDAKSIMGIISLNLSEPVEVEFLGGRDEAFVEAIGRFIVCG